DRYLYSFPTRLSSDLKKFDSTIAGKISYIFHMIPACYHLATSRYFIIDDYYFPVYVIKPRKEVEIIQLWHSAGALKKFGLSTVRSEEHTSELQSRENH